MKFFILIFFLFNYAILIASVHDTTLLKEIVFSNSFKDQMIKDYPNYISIDKNIIALNQTKNLGETLMQESGLYVRHSGTNGLSTLSMRGMNSQQTLLLWNGFPIENLTSGVSDYGLIGNHLTDSIKVENGGGSALWGSSAIGGTIQLYTQPIKSEGFYFKNSTFVSSLEQLYQQNEFGLKKNKFSFKWRSFHHKANNVFEYFNNAKLNSPLEKIKHNASNSLGFLGENYFDVSHQKQIIYRVWFQENKRLFPPNFLQEQNLSSQKDVVVRHTLEFNNKVNNWYQFDIKTALFREQINYEDPAVSLVSIIETNRFIAETNHFMLLNVKHKICYGFFYNFQEGQSQYYDKIPQQNRMALYFAYDYKNDLKKIISGFQVRAEIQNDIFFVTAKSAFEKTFKKNFKIGFSLSKNYRLPTLNDLYWQPGGNLNLRPEDAFLQEFNLEQTFGKPNHLIKWTTSFYSNFVKDMIVWTPSNFAYWSPQNIGKVWARGFETKINQQFNTKNFNINFTGQYSFTLSTNEKETENEKRFYQKQLIYIPIHKANLSSTIEYKNFVFRMVYFWVSKRFIQSDNSESLKPFALTNLYLSKKIKPQKNEIEFVLQVNNLLNVSFQNIAYNAEPLINFKFGIVYFFYN